MTGYPTPTFDSVTVNGQLTASNLPPTPSTGLELAYFRVNSTGTDYEARTPAQVQTDVGLPAPATGNETNYVRINSGGTAFEARTPLQLGSDAQYQQSGIGAVSRGISAKLAEIVSVLDYGADPTGATDSTTAFNNTIATGRPVYIPPGTYKITNAINVSTVGQHIFGVYRKSVLSIPAAFNLSAAGVFNITTAEPGPYIHDVSIIFTQPDTATKSNLTQYPPAFYLQGCPRSRFERVYVQGAWNGWDARSNCGGSEFHQIEASFFNYGIWLDGSEDSVRIMSSHFWPFGLTTSQTSIMTSGAFGINSGRMDDLHINGCLFFCQYGLVTYYGTTTGLLGPTGGTVVSCDFDTYGGINQTCGDLSISGCSFSAGSVNSVALSINASANGNTTCTVSSSYFYIAAALSVGYISLTGNSATNNVRMTAESCIIDSLAVGNIYHVVHGNYCDLTWKGNRHYLNTGTNITNPTFDSSGANSQLTFQGNFFNSHGSASGNVLNIATDAFHVITGNVFNGWGVSLPSGYVTTIVQGNQGLSNGTPAVVTGSRAIGTTYTNNRYQPLFVNVTLNVTAAGNIIMSVAGTQIASQGFASAGTGSWSFVVPQQTTYEVTFSGTASITVWSETPL